MEENNNSASVKEKAATRKKTAHQRMVEHRIKIGAAVAGGLALLIAVFLLFIADYDFKEKAWHVKFDPIHGYTYTLYTKQEYSHAHIVISSCTSKKAEVTIPDTIFGVRVEVLDDHAFSDKVKTIHLGKYIYLVGEGYSDKTFTLPEGYGQSEYYTAFEDKEGSGFYYKAASDGTLTAYAYFGTEESYKIPESFAGLKVGKATEYYVNDEYLTLLAATIAEHASTLPYNMVKVKMIQQNAIDPYIYSMDDLETREKMKTRLMALPDEYNFLPDGSPADGETAIKLAFIHNGDGNGKNCAMVMADYPPLDFIKAERYITRKTSDCHTDGEPDFGEWIMDGFIVL